VTAEDLPNGVANTYTYDGANNISAISDAKGGTTDFSATYTRNADNLVTADTSQPSGVADYKYTAKNQLCYAGSANSTACTSPPTGADPYTYDNAGNLTGNNGRTQSFNSTNELCWSVSGSSSNTCGTAPTGATTYTYSSNGNRTATTPSSGSATAYTFNSLNQLTQYQLGSTTATTYAYNGAGLRMSKTTGSSTTSFTWDDDGNNPLLLEETTGTNTTTYVYGAVGPIEEILPSGTAYYYSGDNLGSTRALTDSSGTVQDTDTYGPYGNVTSSTGSVQNNLLYGGQYLDSESSLYYLRARYYDPSTGEFLSIDPMAGTTLHAYAYTGGDPINQRDPSGQQPSYDGDSPSQYAADKAGYGQALAEESSGFTSGYYQNATHNYNNANAYAQQQQLAAQQQAQLQAQQQAQIQQAAALAYAKHLQELETAHETQTASSLAAPHGIQTESSSASVQGPGGETSPSPVPFPAAAPGPSGYNESPVSPTVLNQWKVSCQAGEAVGGAIGFAGSGELFAGGLAVAPESVGTSLFVSGVGLVGMAVSGVLLIGTFGDGPLACH
jgi:RHS repeat-associated protein